MRSSCEDELVSRALATSKFACACCSELSSTRGSMLASKAPASTWSPVSTGSDRISPDALDFTSTVVTGSMMPAASTATVMSRRSTAAVW